MRMQLPRLLVRQSKERKREVETINKGNEDPASYLKVSNDFRSSVGTIKSVGLEDHNKKGEAEARRGRW